VTERLPISVIVFAKNEANSLAAVLETPLRLAAQVVVMDGASSDDSAAVARRAGAEVLADSGNGKGLAIRAGLRAATQPVVVLMDADGSHDAADIARLVEPIHENRADLVIASRIKGGSDELAGNLTNVLRLMGTLFVTTLINWRFGTHLTDSLNGFRAMRTDLAQSLDLKEGSHTIEHEMVIKALRRGARVTERPSHEFSRRHGVSSLPFWRNVPRFVFSSCRYLLFP